jgi:hypothetical protein
MSILIPKINDLGSTVTTYQLQHFVQVSPPGNWQLCPGVPLCTSKEEADCYMDLIQMGRFRYPKLPTNNEKPELYSADGMYRIIEIITQSKVIYSTEAAE